MPGTALQTYYINSQPFDPGEPGFALRLAASLFELRRHKTPWQVSEPYETWLAGSGFAVAVFVQTGLNEAWWAARDSNPGPAD